MNPSDISSTQATELLPNLTQFSQTIKISEIPTHKEDLCMK